MATINLTDQTTKRDTIQPHIATLKAEMDKRKAIWAKMSFERRKAIIQGDRDVMMSLAWNVWNYLKNNFFGDKFYQE